MATYQVSAGTDDCYRREEPNYWDLGYTKQWAGSESGSYYGYGGGMRFTNIIIEQGATIAEAHLIMTCRDATSDTVCNTRISAEDVDDPATFADNSGAFDSRYANRTTAKVDWDSIGAWTTDTEYTSPELKTVIQEIVDRGGWASGYDIVIFWEDFDNRSSHGYRTAYAYDSSSAKAPKLVITIGETHLGAVTLSGSGSLTSNGVITAIGKATMTGSGVLSAIGQVFKLASVTLTGVGTLVANGVSTLIGKSTLSGSGTLAAKASGIFIGKATLSGSGSLSAIGRRLVTGAVSLVGAGSLSAIGVGIFIGASTLSGLGTLVAKATMTYGRILRIHTTKPSDELTITSRIKGGKRR